ncbi:aspartyl-phosphate phosphatase Spo0E family protein [Fonticella tunisiensis]|uniref:Spo0E like sporulation regulatory protein n=1 Tax=Fonticella tunisiensis TaxID=1096341 RepID=A0A4R7KRG0_9CLOT|nr:aspartyl-phosphate phosphatase Spo0E family protein [Fonticella tunisiensis]TDT61867.1 Spo0E like sporulation regulatory protein [Fonticella tunisiensis]
MLLLDKVEMLRGLLYEFLTHNDREMILRISQELDELIVEYYNKEYKRNM